MSKIQEKTKAISTYGFTLFEVLVALTIISILSALSWRVVQNLYQTTLHAKTHGTALAELQTAISQWSRDLNSVRETQVAPPLLFDGLSFRLVRSYPHSLPEDTPGLMVVAWSKQKDPNSTGSEYWTRWVSGPVYTNEQLRAAWLASETWARNPSIELKKNSLFMFPIKDWQIFYFSGSTLSNPLSSSNPNNHPIPDGIRLIIQLPDGLAVSGDLTIDWIKPSQTAEKSM